MTPSYVAGVILGLVGGILTQSGLLLQKKAVNDIYGAGHERYLRRLIRNPTWLAGSIFGLGGGGIAYVISQSLIGPALVPGLMAIGLIVLAVGSVKLNHESLNTGEIIAIPIMILGVFFIGLSGLQITSDQVRSALANSNSLMRITAFTCIYFVLFFVSRRFILIIKSHRSTFIALANGFLFAQSDFWVNPLIAVIFIVLGGKGTLTQVILFVVASIILTTCGAVVTWQNQMAFRYGQASNIVPITHVPIQISPIIVYFVVFGLPAPTTISKYSVLAGVALTIAAGFLLGRRGEVLADQGNLEI